MWVLTNGLHWVDLGNFRKESITKGKKLVKSYDRLLMVTIVKLIDKITYIDTHNASVHMKQ